MMTDFNWLWKNTNTPEIEALAKKLQKNRFNEDYDNSEFGKDLAKALFLAFKAGVELERKGNERKKNDPNQQRHPVPRGRD